MNVVILGSGAREHALAWKLTQDGAIVHVLPGNPGIPGSVPTIDALDFPAVQQFCQEHDVKLIVPGSEATLAAGVTDFFAQTDIRVFGPSRQAAALESSKVWSKNFMQRHGVATGQAWTFRSDQVTEALAKAAELEGRVVVKYDGLAAGKGVYVCSSQDEVKAALDELVDLHTDWFSFLLEEKLVGPEISVMGATDGNRIRLLATSQDHKQLRAGDQGPNTGGMGAYCPVPFADDNVMAEVRRDIIEPTMRGLQTSQFDFKGFIYFGIMLTPNGPKLLEYNTRLGDPEAEVLLPAMQSSLLDLITAALDGDLARHDVWQRPGHYAGVVLASGGYPAPKFPTGFPITGLDQLAPETLVFLGGVKAGAEAGQLVTGGGRVLVVVTHGDELNDAVQQAYAEIKKISFQDAYYRSDIGQRPSPILTRVY
ncbi:phosphoribosylamine--glycine ligase [Hymenobacter sp. NBH84]|uniref:phosphoribosylamine--glycine ligase n=1 Tax=Hymenobacter sp. NBH84 TaxID=2596915 RepID=UPI00162A76F1|nr:phosphoribosylamine--glycine ligase [Hymenobacter sp. NBH84]QNE41001.1 phosphoribosylamine--glycine ligase [Hymenobacter sp. NBH84]